MQYIFSLEKVSRAFAGKAILKEISLSFYPGAKIGMIGANGAGKSTLLKIIAGVDKDYTGDAKPADGIRIGFVQQEPELDPKKSVKENVEEGVKPVKDLLARYDEVSARLSEPLSDKEMEKALDQQARLQEEIDRKNAWEIDRHVEMAMHALGCPPGDSPVTTLSGGEKRRVALCRTLLSQPDLLLMDEPTNHLDADAVAWLETHLKAYPGTVIVATHDRYFLENVAEWMLELDHGRAYPYKGNYESYLDQKRQRIAVEEKKADEREKLLARELEWIRTNPSARTGKNKARISNYHKLLADQTEERTGPAEFSLPPAPVLGNRVLEVQGIKKGYDGKILFENLSFSIPPGAIVGIIGANGLGKTTLAKIMVGAEKPDAGTVKLGEKTVVAYVDQTRDSLDPKKTVFEEVCDGMEQIPFGKRFVPGRGYLAQFNFRGPDQQKRVGDLSGGERNRVQLAKLLRKGANLILLDEPTNDLDVDTLRSLEEAIQSFAGSLVIITHDRWFLDRIATHIVSFEGDGQVRWFEGAYSSYEEFRERERKEKGQSAEAGKGKYRKFGI